MLTMLILIILTILASWRLTNLLVNEPGPFNLSYYFRKLIGTAELNGELPPNKEPFVASLFGCLYCTSVWSGIIFTVLLGPLILSSEFNRETKSYLILILPFAISAGTIMVAKFLKEDTYG